MNQKKHILLLTTGGTIASMPGYDGLEPRRSQVMDRELNQLRCYYDITVKDVMCLDSSNMRPEEWQQIARVIFENRLDYDGIVVSHGTDTMAYTASAVTLCCRTWIGPWSSPAPSFLWQIFSPTAPTICAPPLPWPLPGIRAFSWPLTARSCGAAGP